MTHLIRPAGRWRTRGMLAGTVAALAVGMAAAMAPPASAKPVPADEGVIRHAGGATAVPDSYIVAFRDTAVAARAVGDRAGTLAGRVGGKVARTYRHAVRGFEFTGSAEMARRVAADPSVAYVEQNHRVRKTDTQSPTPSWGLDRIDQRPLALDNSYTYPTTASGVRVYIVDSGIRFSHSTFGGRAVSGYDAIDGGTADDCDGHGTHVAGTAGGREYGVAKGVTLVAVRVLDCAGSGTYGQVIAGIDWVTGDHDPGEPAVANMSLGGPTSSTIDTAVENAIADGVSFAVAAGNEEGDACDSSPASAPNAITVAATGGDEEGIGRNDERASFTNWGSCVDIFAPGVAITSSTIDSNTSSDTWNGTSMASPHVAGAAALVLAQNPTFTPRQVRDHLVGNGTTGAVINPGPGSPNVLLHVENAAPAEHDFSVSVSPAAGSTPPGGSLTATVNTTVTAGDPQPVTLTASGLPAGATASFAPASITSGGSSTLTINVAGSTPPGSYSVTVTGTGTEATRAATYALTVQGPPGCSGSNDTATPIPDASSVESTITISGCSAVPSTTSAVEVHIVHTYRGDLVVSLIAPDGSAYVLHDRTGGDAANLDQTFAVDLSGEAANGTWRLRVQDAAALDVGYLSSWRLDLGGGGGGSPGTCSGSNPTDLTIPDASTAESTITVSGCAGNASASSTVEVRIVHTYRGDLVVSLVAPDGSAYVLHNRTGGDADNLNQVYRVDLSGETANGTWRLRVQDVAYLDTGYLDSWSLDLAGGNSPTVCYGSNNTDVPITSLSTVQSTITLSGCSGNASATSEVEVHIVHTWIGDLVVSLVAPDGSAYVLHNRTGEAAQNIDRTYQVNLSGEGRNGAWRLRVQDAELGDSGYIDGWSLTL
ncbi:proprotein convertase P-domain-containing protein [Plantactinospora sp. B6F1]|uniref:proprotein convertase P-domain-containing protein n=1 Tax=Plantactinospora sp. B6F1 TaxID=3158971 RepID=UPI0032D8F505